MIIEAITAVSTDDTQGAPIAPAGRRSTLGTEVLMLVAVQLQGRGFVFVLAMVLGTAVFG